jgi:molybdopterin converting factor small subunit
VSVTFVLPGQLRPLAGGRSTVALERDVSSVAEALDALRADYPHVYDRILNERRELRPHVNVFVGMNDIRWAGGLGAPVPEGSEVVILPSVSGG